MTENHLKWEHLGEYDQRAAVPGGWLYRTRIVEEGTGKYGQPVNITRAVSMVFVPEVPVSKNLVSRPRIRKGPRPMSEIIAELKKENGDG
jgi:hypothetical protein